jgi:hypothetical protein
MMVHKEWDGYTERRSHVRSFSLPEDAFKSLLAEASELGAQRALAKLGLADEDAAKDVSEVRTLLDSYRDFRQSISRSFGRLVGLLLFILLALGVISAIKAPEKVSGMLFHG